MPNASEQRKINIICLLVHVHREDAEYDHLSAPMRTLLLYCLCETQFVKNKKFAVHLRKEHEVGARFATTFLRGQARHLVLVQGPMREKELGQDSTGKVSGFNAFEGCYFWSHLHIHIKTVCMGA